MTNNLEKAPVESDALSQQIIAEQARTLHQQVPKSLVGGAGVGLCFVVLAYRDFGLAVISIWILIYLAVTLIRFVSYWQIKPYLEDDERICIWARQMPYILFFPGLVWGAISFGMVLSSDIITACILVALLAGLSSGAVGAMAVIHRSYVAYALPMTVPFIVSLLIGPTSAHRYIAAPVFLFMLVNIGFSKNIYQLTLNAIKTRLENDQLMKKMASQQSILKEQNVEVQNAMQKAHQANRAKSVFLASASHDLAQPLHSMNLFLIALQTEQDPDRQKVLIEKARTCGDNMSGLFMSLLDISKLDAGIVSVDKRVLDIADIIEPLATEFAEIARQKDIEFHTELLSCVTETDPTIVQRVVRNLLHNALKYTSQGHVSLGIELDQKNQIIIRVRDTGSGIESSELDNIFDEFYQVGNSERDRTKGLGLGLAIVRRLSDLIELKITVTSSVGDGTEFKISLPACAEIPGLYEVAKADQTHKQILNSSLIVFIDDEDDTRTGMSLILKNLGFDVIAAESLEDALKQLISQDLMPNMLISDYRLRERRTGVEAIKALRDEFNTEIPALIITGDTSKESLLDIKENGIDVIHKLSSQSLLKSKIEEALVC